MPRRTPYEMFDPMQREIFLTALKGIVSNPKLFGADQKISAGEAVKLAVDVTVEATCVTAT